MVEEIRTLDIGITGFLRELKLSYWISEELGGDPATVLEKVKCDGCLTQVFPAPLIVGHQQLQLAAALTFEAYLKGTAVSKKPEIQFLLFFTGTRQISQAIEKSRELGGPPYILVRACIHGNTCSPPPSQWEVISEEEVGAWTDLRTVSKMYGVNLTGKERAEALKTVLTAIAYSKLLMR
ncbi:MAG: hypothetical protein J7L55_00280 [Desulfurococcales archaeon]|nr:hypothetical protein [Desulfurococcales archaeon]